MENEKRATTQTNPSYINYETSSSWLRLQLNLTFCTFYNEWIAITHTLSWQMKLHIFYGHKTSYTVKQECSKDCEAHLINVPLG